MHEFKFNNQQLYCESVPVAKIAKQVGTPVYIYSQKTLIDHYEKLRCAFRQVNPLICFSVKANGNLAILKTLVSRGAGLDIVSGGELYRAEKAGCPAQRIVYASVGKRPDEIRQALKKDILCFNVESVPELEMINEEARRSGIRARVALRLNPDVEADTHPHITTGTAQTKFGIDMLTAKKLVCGDWGRFGHTSLLGFHLHIGSQITNSSPFVKAIKKASDLIRLVRSKGVRVELLNLGGGLGIVYKDEKPQTADDFAKAVLPLIASLGVRLVLEPGRFIVGNAGILVTQVLFVKNALKKKFLVVDAGMTDLIRPALYGAYHEIVPAIRKKMPKTQVYDVVGPVCESADALARNRKIAAVGQGDFLAVLGAGAYGFSMASNYNGRLRPPEVMVRGDRFFMIRDRESLEDLIRNEKTPGGLFR